MRLIRFLMTSRHNRQAVPRRDARPSGARQTVQDYAHDAAPTKPRETTGTIRTIPQATATRRNRRCLTSALQLILRVAH